MGFWMPNFFPQLISTPNVVLLKLQITKLKKYIYIYLLCFLINERFRSAELAEGGCNLVGEGWAPKGMVLGGGGIQI